MEELLAQMSESPDVIDTFEAEKITEAQAALNDAAEGILGGTIEVPDVDAALDEIEALSVRLAARSEALAESATARAGKLASIKTALGVEAQEPEPEEEPEPEPEEEPETVTASGTLKGIAKRIPKDRQPVEPEYALSLTASAGPQEGDQLVDRLAVGKELLRGHSIVKGMRPGTSMTMATIDTGSGLKYSIDDPDSAEQAMKVFDQVTREAQMGTQPGVGALVAAGGFCAPAEPRYEFFNIASSAGLLNLPTVAATRGQVTYPVSPSLADFLGQSGIATEWTNANDITPADPATKPVYTFVCPENVTCAVIAWPTILQFGNFVARFYPEAVANATALAMVAADRTVNAARIAAIAAAATSAAPTDTGAGGIVNLLTNLASHASDYRERYGMSPDAFLDGAAPTWVREALYADAIARDSTTAYDEVRRRVDGALSQLNIRMQWVYDLDDANDGLFPQTADILLWAPGTVVELDGGELNLGVVRDSTLNSTNDYQTFAEPFVGWCFPGHEVLLLNEVEVCPTGGSGARVTIACPATS